MKHSKSGETLVEALVTLLVFGILMALITAVISPASKIYVRMQKLQYAQTILDNTLEELRGLALEASGNGYVKIYETCDPETDLTVPAKGTGRDRGRALEFVNTQGYAGLISADGCPETDLYLGTSVAGTIGEGDILPGRLFTRYYVRSASSSSYDYQTAEGQKLARAADESFTDGYYMETYLELEFSYPETPDSTKTETDGTVVSYYSYLCADLRLYSDPERTKLLVQDSAMLDFRSPIRRFDGLTASQKGI